MSQKIHILYISGFGDKYDRLRLRCLSWWKFSGVTVELIPMKWESGTFEQKLARIDTAINRAKGKKVVVIGESAGGSMAVHTYARRANDIYKVMTLCGKNTHPEGVSESYYVHYPAFRESMNQLNASIETLTHKQKSEFVSIHPLYDPTVPVRETLLPGCRQMRLWTVGHFTAIVLALTILSPLIVRAARRTIS
jgi:predicted alpha/beta hydrolase family esterase